MENVRVPQPFAPALPHMSDFCIAAAQTKSIPGDVDANVARHCEHLVAASRAGVSLLLFPELSLSGYALESLASCALTQHAHALENLKAAAAKTGVTEIV